MCFICRSLERHRAFVPFHNDHLKKHIVLDKKKKVIVFSEKRWHRIAKYLTPITNVVTADSKPGYDITLNIQRMKGVRDEIIDCIVLSHVLSSVRNDVDAINEVYRVLKPGGVVIVNDSISEEKGKMNVLPRVYTWDVLQALVQRRFEVKDYIVLDPISRKPEVFFVGTKPKTSDFPKG